MNLKTMILGGRNDFHGFCDLGNAMDALNVSSDLAQIGHYGDLIDLELSSLELSKRFMQPFLYLGRKLSLYADRVAQTLALLM